MSDAIDDKWVLDGERDNHHIDDDEYNNEESLFIAKCWLLGEFSEHKANCLLEATSIYDVVFWGNQLLDNLPEQEQDNE